LAQERKDEGKSEIVKLATHERNGRG